ncbi:uncharacterized protein LOC116414977 [Apis florea]|uniref:uncharacterized protein LOC116414977 n=1 Tax=Apis florea TaxID=7463 RepID=UPI0012FF26D4|nr:uncharacterized protein LOC116414977 [Apis florea]
MALKSSDKLEITEEILELFREQTQSVSLKSSSGSSSAVDRAWIATVSPRVKRGRKIGHKEAGDVERGEGRAPVEESSGVRSPPFLKQREFRIRMIRFDLVTV